MTHDSYDYLWLMTHSLCLELANFFPRYLEAAGINQNSFAPGAKWLAFWYHWTVRFFCRLCQDWSKSERIGYAVDISGLCFSQMDYFELPATDSWLDRLAEVECLRRVWRNRDNGIRFVTRQKPEKKANGSNVSNSLPLSPLYFIFLDSLNSWSSIGPSYCLVNRIESYQIS